MNVQRWSAHERARVSCLHEQGQQALLAPCTMGERRGYNNR
jgi:hypothetical protein